MNSHRRPADAAVDQGLNRHLSDDLALIALELGRLVLKQPAEILVSATYGAEIAAEKKKTSGTTKWSAEALKDAAAAIADDQQRKVVLQLVARAADHGALIKGGTSPSPSGGFYYSIGAKQPSVWSLYTKPEGAIVVVNLASISGASEAAARQALASLRSSASLDARLHQDDDEAMKKYPSFPLSEVLSDPTAGDALVQSVAAAVVIPVQATSSALPGGHDGQEGETENAAGPK